VVYLRVTVVVTLGITNGVVARGKEISIFTKRKQ